MYRRDVVGLVLLCTATAMLLVSCGETDTGLTDAGAPAATDIESSGTLIPVPGLDIEKSTNGHDADTAPGPSIQVGDPVLWEYVVTNTGNVGLSNITVDDDVLGLICTIDFLAPGESVTCSATGAAAPGQYVNTGTATWSGDGLPDIKDSDVSHYFGEEAAMALDIEKSTNGHDADTVPGPVIPVGASVTWTYVVTNTGSVPLSDILVEDDVLGPICTIVSLAPGESATCTATGIAVAGQYANNGTATYSIQGGPQIMDSDSSHYFGEETAGDDGCSHGYWKNHSEDWPAAGYAPDQSVASVFGAAATYPDIGSATLMEALEFKGGKGVEGGARNLLRQAVASLLNAAHPDVTFPWTVAGVVNQVNATLAGGAREAMLDLAGDMDEDNNLGCPFDDDRERLRVRVKAGEE